MLEGSVIYKTFSDAALLRNLKTERFDCCQRRPVFLKTDCELYFLKVERFSFGNVKKARLSGRLLSTNIPHQQKVGTRLIPEL